MEVVVTGLGVLSPVGLDLNEVVASICNGASGIGLWESSRSGRSFPAGIIRQSFTDQFTRLELPYLDRCSQLAILAARQAIRDAGLELFDAHGARAGLFYGTVRGGAEAEEEWARQFYAEQQPSARPFTVMAIMHNAAAAHISIRHKISGPVVTHTSACTSSGTAIGEAFRSIRDGYLDVAVVGGADAPLTPSFFGAWEATRALANVDPADVGNSCRPFAKARTGLVLAEGAAFLVLESVEHAAKRSATVYAALSGYGVAADTYHIGSPHFQGQAAAIAAALGDAGLHPDQIGYYNAHATGTKGGDIVEANAIRTAFGDTAKRLPVSSTKSIHGHLLGAASAIELLITVLAVRQGLLPPTHSLIDIDPECDLNHIITCKRLEHHLENAMSFSSGFGGTNTAFIVSRCRSSSIKPLLNMT